MKRSVSFGLNSLNADSYQGWPGFLSGCWNDADKMASLLATAGYEARGFFDADCTLGKLRTELTIAAAQTEPGDTFVFSNSGHGTQSLGPWFTSEEGMAMYDGIIGDSEFRQLLSQFKPGVNVVACLDVCHAGGLSRALGVRGRVAPLWVTRNMAVAPKAAVDVQANAIIMAACQRDELSGDGDVNGAFTCSALESLQEGMTWRQWMAATQRYMSRLFPTQHPQLITVGSGDLADKVV